MLASLLNRKLSVCDQSEFGAALGVARLGMFIDKNISNKLIQIFDIYWKDNVKSRLVNSKINNEYRNLSKTKLRSQQEIYDLHLKELEK